MTICLHGVLICGVMFVFLALAALCGWMLAEHTDVSAAGCYVACVILAATLGCLFIAQMVRAEMERAYVVLAHAVAKVSGLSSSGLTVEQFASRIHKEVHERIAGVRFRFITVSDALTAPKSNR